MNPICEETEVSEEKQVNSLLEFHNKLLNDGQRLTSIFVVEKCIICKHYT